MSDAVVYAVALSSTMKAVTLTYIDNIRVHFYHNIPLNLDWVRFGINFYKNYPTPRWGPSKETIPLNLDWVRFGINFYKNYPTPRWGPSKETPRMSDAVVYAVATTKAVTLTYIDNIRLHFYHNIPLDLDWVRFGINFYKNCPTPRWGPSKETTRMSDAVVYAVATMKAVTLTYIDHLRLHFYHNIPLNLDWVRFGINFYKNCPTPRRGPSK
ncbi:hypothetical protein QE152_g21885 [Popillia japonica]|uniref:Uncharacterized protein n=1 Tax=Popillia japonica TaxID=7064 RepID=A0AAW1KML8_POPJA